MDISMVVDNLIQKNKRDMERQEREPGSNLVFRPNFPWQCPTCCHYLFLNKKDGCVICDQHKHDLSFFNFKHCYPMATQSPVQLPPSTKKLVQVINQGPAKQRQKTILPPKAEGATRFVCISDTHTKHREMFIPDGDVLIHSGHQQRSVLEGFNKWMKDRRKKEGREKQERNK
eukprot:TRINITY_DN3495_c0_g1_i1.p2 TRINITY_DN3495_c0_g1~~TRINITY_DN3495_c0_g1_i1.p2  ORF type:complete len:173 (-),score=26.85 TRINITY_DN3495_c0_g1_i1:631-1149(-)